MNIDRKYMKREARLAMRDHKPSIYLTALVFLVITFVLEILSTKLQYPGLTFAELAQTYYDPEGGQELLFSSILQRNFLSRVLTIAISVMSVVISCGFSNVCLCVSRRITAGIGDMFDVFGFFLKVLWLYVVTSIFVALWLMLLVVPGIVASYRYSMAPFILLDDPDKSVMQCIRESKDMTCGHKWELFILDLSLIGWEFLSAIPLLQIYTLPYITVTKANYFNALSGYVPVHSDPAEPDSGNDSFE